MKAAGLNAVLTWVPTNYKNNRQIYNVTVPTYFIINALYYTLCIYLDVL